MMPGIPIAYMLIEGSTFMGTIENCRKLIAALKQKGYTGRIVCYVVEP